MSPTEIVRIKTVVAILHLKNSKEAIFLNDCGDVRKMIASEF